MCIHISSIYNLYIYTTPQRSTGVTQKKKLKQKTNVLYVPVYCDSNLYKNKKKTWTKKM